MKLLKPDLAQNSYVNSGQTVNYVTWKRKRVRGSGSVWKRRSEIFKKIRKRIRVGSVSIYRYIYIYI